MVSVHLTFQPPDQEDITKLYIYESTVSSDVGAVIETVTAVGTYPDYISTYTTALATTANDYFRIQWEDSKGAKTDISAPVRGGTETVVGQVVKRVLERSPNLSPQVVQQEAEAAIQFYYGTNVDPYDVTLDPNYVILNGLTYLVLARASVATAVISGGDVASATIGLVSMRSGSTASSSKVDYTALFDIAFNLLGKPGSVVLQMTEIQTIYGAPAWANKTALIGAVIEP
jgi:hypothetical protein